MEASWRGGVDVDGPAWGLASASGLGVPRGARWSNQTESECLHLDFLVFLVGDGAAHSQPRPPASLLTVAHLRLGLSHARVVDHVPPEASVLDERHVIV